MRKLRMVVPWALLLCLTSGCQQQADPAAEAGVTPLSDEDTAAIRAIGPAIDRATLDWDMDALLDLWTEDTILMNLNAPLIQGRSQVAQYFEAYETADFREHKHQLLEIDGYGDIAYARGAYKVVYALEGADEPVEDIGKTLLIFRKQSDGIWRISHFCHNPDLPQSQ